MYHRFEPGVVIFTAFRNYFSPGFVYELRAFGSGKGGVQFERRAPYFIGSWYHSTENSNFLNPES